MKKIIIILIVLNLLMIIIIGFNNIQLKKKIVVIDVIEVLNKSGINKKLESSKTIKEEALQSKVDTLLNEFHEELKIFEKERAVLNSDERNNKLKLLENKQNQIQQFSQIGHQRIEKEYNNSLSKELNRINEIIKEFAKRNKYEVILGATGSSNILFVKGKDDVTVDFIEYLEKRQ